MGVIVLIVGYRHRREFALPVAGLDEAKAQSIYFALKRAASTPDQERVASEWLAALQLLQVASARIFAEMDAIESNLQFWTRRLDAGRHFWFTLFHRGPVEFAKKVAQLVRHGRRRQEGGEVHPRDQGVSDAELVEKRVLIFRLLRAELSEAAASIQAAAALLYLQQERQQSINDNGGASTSRGAGAAEIASQNEENDQDLFIKAHNSVESCMLAVSHAFRTLESGVHDTLDSQQAPDGAATGDQRMLSQALGRVLGVIPLRRIWSKTGEAPGTTAVEATAAGDEALAGGPGATATAAAASTTNDVMAAVQNAVGFIPMSSPDMTVHIALAEARRAAVLLQRSPRRLVPVPVWLEMPSQVQQNWVRYSVLGLAVGYGTIFIIRHSRLTGSHDLDNWIKAAAEGVRSAWAEHVIGPLERVRGELFNTFRRRPVIVSMGEYEADRDSLQRMLEDFKTDFIQRRGTAAALANRNTTSSGDSSGGGVDTGVAVVEVEDVQLLEGMELMMRSYEQELKRPVRNLVSGDLMRSLLIQVQKLKVDTESAMLEIDQILRANELSISLVAAVPAFLIAGVVLYSLGNAVTPTPPDPKREAVPARLAMIEVERALETLASCEEVNSEREGKVAEATGMFIFRLAVAYREAEELFKRHRGMFGRENNSEWNNLRADLLELAAPAPAGQKLRTTARMMRAYAVYQQF
jgi:nuclear-control-of-ATPase protein 2